ncbi:YrzI family small protein [Metabacillus litoralis]|nr:YrzI family small protein [Metabacillus litoralis]
MTINLFFITLTFSKRNQSKQEVEKNERVQQKMEKMKEREYELFRNM